MTHRKASVVVVVFTLICSIPVFLVARNFIDGPILTFFRDRLNIELNQSWPLYLAFFIVFFATFRFIIDTLSPFKDAVDYVVDISSRDKQQTAAIPKLKLSRARQQHVRATLIENVRLATQDYFQEALHTVLGAYDLPKTYEPRRLRNAT